MNTDETDDEAAITRTSAEQLQQTELQIRDYLSGDLRALDDLFRRYYPVVRRIVEWRMAAELRRITDAEDLVQDALIKAFRSIASFEQRSDATFRNWLATIVENRVRDALRDAHADKRDIRREQRFAGNRDEGTTSSMVAGNEGTPSEAAILGAGLTAAQARDARREVAVLELSAAHRELINLRENCGMSFVEMARHLGRKPDTVRMMFRRACARLEQRLGAVD